MLLEFKTYLSTIHQNINKIFLSALVLFLMLVYYTDFGTEIGLVSDREKVIRLVRETYTLTLSIIIEAFPFIVLGVLVSIIVALFVKEEWFFRLIPKDSIFSHIAISFFGFFMPVCECGNVPVARRLMLKGFNVSHAMTFLLAAPILNPVTFWSTYQAFSYDKNVVLYRMVAGFLIANIVGFLISRNKDQNEILTKDFYNDVCCELDLDHDHNHDHNQSHSHNEPKFKQALGIFEEEFMGNMKMMLFGAFIAALSQIIVSRNTIVNLPQTITDKLKDVPVLENHTDLMLPILTVLLPILVMIILAFVISICSNVDAFVALSYASLFSTGPIVAFLVFGPMIDMKMLSMMKNSFKASFLAKLTVVVFMLSVITGLVVNLISSV